MPVPDEHSDRLGRLEKAVGDLTSSVSSLAATVNGMANTQAKHETRLESAEAIGNQRGKVDWQAYGFILAFVGAIGFMAKEPMDYRIASNAQGLRDLDVTLQREMRLLDDTMKSEIAHLAEGREDNRVWLLNLERRMTRTETIMEAKP